MSDDKDLIAEARQEESIHDKLGDGFSEGSEERAFYYGHRDRYKRLADALETANTERAAVPDAALDAVARVRALHYEEDHECAECSFEPMLDAAFLGVSVPWPCSTIQALDGAPEPEEKP